MRQAVRVTVAILLAVFFVSGLSCTIRKADSRQNMDMLPDEPFVYVGRTGLCYHEKTCMNSQTERFEMPLSDAQRFYKPCTRCKPQQ